MVIHCSARYEDTSYCAWDCPRRQYLALLFGFLPPLIQYLLTPVLKYREYWVLERGSDSESLELYNGENRESASLACYVYGTPPASARGALKGTSRDRKRSISFFQKMIPQLINRGSHRTRPLFVLLWKAKGIKSEATRSFLSGARCFVYLWATVVLSSLVLVPAAHATTWFMATVGLLLYHRYVLVALDFLPGVMFPIEEVTVR